jgi:uncharacterized lipoprotein YddW (UPF0748 family)
MRDRHHRIAPWPLFSIVIFVILHLEANAQEFRGLWVDAFGPGFWNQEEVTKLVSDCRKYNFNAVVVQMRRRGDAFYQPHVPNLEPRTVSITNDFDALGELVQQCHTGTPRIEVHAWLVSHFVWSSNGPPPQADHVFNKHPEYLSCDSIGQRWIGNGYYLDPGNPEANFWIRKVAVDVVSHYDVDGLHWDYCRYPQLDSGYNATALARFKKETGTEKTPVPNDPKFSAWRRSQVTMFLKEVNAELYRIKPSLIISAAVFANADDSFQARLADWHSWLKEELIDVAIPMNFTDKNELFKSRTKDALSYQYNRRIYVGQGGYKTSAENTVAQLACARSAGAGGTVFYDYRHTNVGHSDQDRTLAYIRDHFQPTWTNPPRYPWKVRPVETVRNDLKAP